MKHGFRQGRGQPTDEGDLIEGVYFRCIGVIEDDNNFTLLLEGVGGRCVVSVSVNDHPSDTFHAGQFYRVELGVLKMTGAIKHL